jgi:hypothetical protein
MICPAIRSAPWTVDGARITVEVLGDDQSFFEIGL